ncbi:MAG: hypothetical protein ACRC0R_06520 [Cetobacterium sp.]
MKSKQESLNVIIRGIIVDNKDPMNIRRLRIRVPYLHGTEGSENKIEDGMLPWANTSIPEQYHYEIGSRVYLAFEDGDINIPVIIGKVNENLENSRIGTSGTSGTSGKSGADTYMNGAVFADSDNYQKEEVNYYRNMFSTSRKGTRVYNEEADGREHIGIIDRVGNWIKFICPTTPSVNASNSAKRSSLNPGNVFGKLSKGLTGLFYRTVANGIIYALDSDSGCEITLANTKSGAVGMKIKDDITLTVGGSTSVVITGDSITMSVGASSIVIDQSGVIIDGGMVKVRSSTLELNGATTIAGGSINLESPSLVHNGSSATFNSAVALASPGGSKSAEGVSPAPPVGIVPSEYDKEFV